MGADVYMDLAHTAVEDIFGRLVSYAPMGGSAVADPAGRLKAAYQGSYVGLDMGATVDASERVEALSFRASLLEEFDIAPQQGDVVTFDLRDVPRTYTVTDVRKPGPGSVLLILGERRASP